MTIDDYNDNEPLAELLGVQAGPGDVLFVTSRGKVFGWWVSVYIVGRYETAGPSWGRTEQIARHRALRRMRKACG